jgi:hypothetical protein
LTTKRNQIRSRLCLNAIVLSALITGMACVQIAKADTFGFSTTGAPVGSIDTSNGTPASTIELDGNSVSGLNIPGIFTQTLNFFSGYDGTAGPIPFSLVEIVTVINETTSQSEQQTITIFGQELVSPTSDPDTIQLFAGPTTFFSTLGVNFTPNALTFLDSPPFPGGTMTQTFSADITEATPEPATYGYMVSGLAGLLIMVRRKVML